MGSAGVENHLHGLEIVCFYQATHLIISILKQMTLLIHEDIKDLS